MDRMNGLKRTHYCNDVREDLIGQEVVVCGWAAKRHNLGQLVFIDLRDRTGIVQLAFGDETARDVFEKAETVRSEFVLMAKGTVKERSSKNPDLPTGNVEVAVTDLRILGKSETRPSRSSTTATRPNSRDSSTGTSTSVVRNCRRTSTSVTS